MRDLVSRPEKSGSEKPATKKIVPEWKVDAESLHHGEARVHPVINPQPLIGNKSWASIAEGAVPGPANGGAAGAMWGYLWGYAPTMPINRRMKNNTLG